MVLECFYLVQKGGFSASLPSRSPPTQHLVSFPHLLTVASDENQVVSTYMDRGHGVEQKENMFWNQTDPQGGVHILAPSP